MFSKIGTKSTFTGQSLHKSLGSKITFCVAGNSDIQWCFSQVKGTLDDNVTEGKIEQDVKNDLDQTIHVSADIISCVEFNQDGELLATGDKGGRVVIFQVKNMLHYKSEFVQLLNNAV